MKAIALLPIATTAFAPLLSFRSSTAGVSSPLQGYLDDLSKELYAPDPDAVPELETHEATDMDKSKVDRGGVGDWEGYVEFGDFDGGDGQMGVLGDGNAGLEKFGDDYQATVVNKQNADLQQVRQETSKTRSAKIAWGTNTGYGDRLRNEGVDTSRAQQMENWANQRDLHARNRQNEAMAANDEVSNHDEDWRMLAKFGADRVSDVDYDEAFGNVEVGGEVVGTVEMKSSMNRVETHTISLKNPYMGFADYRASLTYDSSPDFSVSPNEGSLSKEPVEFVIKFKPSSPIVHAQAFLVIETEDFKKSWRFLGST